MPEQDKKNEIAESIHPADAAENQDAQLTAEAIEEGMQEAPQIDVSSDYEASKQFAANPHADTKEGAKAIADATAPQFPVPEPKEVGHATEASSDPADYLDMAKDINPTGGQGKVSDDLMQKALEKGQPG